jgi:peptidoglycan/LPS O-acetylase OafA/YrhL
MMVYGYDEGVVAVISFMLLSGYVMTVLIDKHYPVPQDAPRFYLDRLGRLLPQFFFYNVLVLALLQVSRLGAATLPWMQYKSCPASLIWLNFSLIGNNFHRFLGNCMLLPASWSLGLEASFYAVAPLVLCRVNRFARALALPLSAAFFVLAYFGVLDSDLYGYRFIPGTLFIFATGAALAKPSLFAPKAAACVWLFALVLFAVAWFTPAIYARQFDKEVLLGILVGVPALKVLGTLKFSDLDELLGNLSYGVFLNHILLIWFADAYLGIGSWSIGSFAVLMICASLAATASFYLVERPALRWRRRIRRAQHVGNRGLVESEAAASL